MTRLDASGRPSIPWRDLLRSYVRFLVLQWRANRGLTALRIVLQLLSATMQSLQIFFFGLLVAAVTSGNTDRAYTLVIGSAISYGLQKLADNLLQSKLADWGERSVTLAAHEAVYAHLSKIAPERLLEPDIRRDLDYVREELWRINSLPAYTEQLFRSVIQLIGAMSLATTSPWWVMALVLGVAVFQALDASFEAKNDLWASMWNSLDGRRIEYTKYVFMMGEDFRELRLLGAAPRLLDRFREASGRVLARYKKTGFSSATARFILAFAQGVAYAVILFVFAPQAFKNPALLGSLYVSLNLFGLVGEGLGGITTAIARLTANAGILARVDHVFHIPEETSQGHQIPRERLMIEFKNVGYHYPGTERFALRNISLTLRENEHVAIVGENGAGKSTFLRLLASLDKPSEGEILVNGKPLDSYKPAEWRRAFHLLLQSGKLYQDFIQDNLLFGEPDARWAKHGVPVSRALKISGADAVVRELKSGLNTFIGDWVAPPGIEPHNVSGGQTQRLLIARTLVHGGRMLAFDEPTSAMDALAETAFFEQLHEEMQGKGIIYISHRFSTVRRANRIIVFENGAMMEDGSHEDLLAKGGTYAKLYEEQAKWYN
ncbi:ABC transporter ATP-binding protein/permease [Candidatus Uhrbacteria bacterium]|nr:ABC transporter ATP-binding protein/permease [Candidatus Uhrbacteria bacterium]